MTTEQDILFAGRFYKRDSLTGALREVGPGEPDVWICRRAADFPGRTIPKGAALANCTRCFARIIFNPARPVRAKKICMQCAAIKPLPFEQ